MQPGPQPDQQQLICRFRIAHDFTFSDFKRQAICRKLMLRQ
jgi:hypothetical protein